MVIEKRQALTSRSRDSAGTRFSITVLECDFSNQPLGDGCRDDTTRYDQDLKSSSLSSSIAAYAPGINGESLRPYRRGRRVAWGQIPRSCRLRRQGGPLGPGGA